ncbi:MAG: SRPBCC family protein [Sphingobacteriales bacterium]
METTENAVITIEAIVNAPAEKAWEVYTNPKHVTHWNHASDDWHSPSAQNDLRPGGIFSYRMEAKDGSFGFDFGGTYDEVKPNELLSYTIGDGRTVKNVFTDQGGATKVTVAFEAENQNPVELQRGGWQAILDNFKLYAESL